MEERERERERERDRKKEEEIRSGGLGLRVSFLMAAPNHFH